MTTKKETTPVVKKEKTTNEAGLTNVDSNAVTKSETAEAIIADDAKIDSISGNNPIENLIGYIKSDQESLSDVSSRIESLKDEKREIVDRIKDLRRDIVTLYKYATPDQKEVLDGLGFDLEAPSHGLNSVAQCALDIVAKSKKRFTNEELYNEYVTSLPIGEEPVNYTQFNIKLRSPLNTNLLVRKEVNDGNGSRTDIIYMNGGSSVNK